MLSPPTVRGQGKVTAPTILIWGTNDQALTKELATGSLKYAENIQLEFIEGASHFVNVDAYERVNELIYDFLS